MEATSSCCWFSASGFPPWRLILLLAPASRALAEARPLLPCPGDAFYWVASISGGWGQVIVGVRCDPRMVCPGCSCSWRAARTVLLAGKPRRRGAARARSSGTLQHGHGRGEPPFAPVAGRKRLLLGWRRARASSAAQVWLFLISRLVSGPGMRGLRQRVFTRPLFPTRHSPQIGC